MSLAMKPLLPPPPAESFEADKVVQDVLANADPSLADAVREFVAKAPVIAVVTESAEPVYIDEKRDTLEAAPLEKPAAEADAPPGEIPFADRMTAEIEPIAHDTTASVIVNFDEPAAITHAAPTSAAMADTQKVDANEQKIEHEPPSIPESPKADDTAAPSESPHEPDKIAEERGIPPLRLPKLSAAFVPIRDAVRSMSARTVVIASVSVATVSVAVAVGAVMWARGAGAEPNRDVARVEPQQTIAPLPAPLLATQTPGVCTLTVRTSHPDAIVWLDGTPLGVAPQTITGECHRAAVVEVRHPRYADFKRELAVDGDLEIDARLEREKTELTVWSEPPGAEVVFEGRVLGKTPLTTTVNRYEVGELIFHANGYQTDWRRIVPKQAKKTVAITLKKAR